MHATRGEKVFHVINVLFMVVLILVFFLPYWVIFAASFTDEITLLKNGFAIFPQKLSLDAYRFIFQNDNRILKSVGNSVFITVVGTLGSVAVSSMMAYPLSKKKLSGNRGFNFFIVFTMMFSGGLVPFYLVVTGLGMYNSLAALIVPGLVSVWNVILLRNFFAGIPSALEEAAAIDGASHFQRFTRVVLPMSKPILATVALFSAVGYWNDWYMAMLFIEDKNKIPVQSLIREMLSSFDTMLEQSGAVSSGAVAPQESVKMAAVIVASLPIILLYPFMQKYFIQGIILGSVKE